MTSQHRHGEQAGRQVKSSPATLSRLPRSQGVDRNDGRVSSEKNGVTYLADTRNDKPSCPPNNEKIIVQTGS